MAFLSSRATLIYNPYAGFWDWGSVVENVAHFWQQQGWDVAVQATAYAGHATQLARAAADAHHGLVLAAGGDGTLNEAANGVVDSETVLAHLPTGTANSFARDLCLARPNLLKSSWPLDVSKALIRGRVQRMDVGKCDNGRHWMLWASAGIDGFVVKRIEPRSRWFKRLGPIGYALKVLFFLPGFSGVRATVVVDNQVIEGDFLLINVSNCRMFAGGELPLNRGAVLDDGQFEVWLFRGRHWSTAARYIMEIGLESHVCNPNVHVWIGRYVAVETHPPTPFHLDGEPVNNTPFSCELKPKALRLLVPDTTPANLFANRGEAL